MKRVEVCWGAWHAALELGRKNPPVEPAGNRFETGFEDWHDAKVRATGYDAAPILAGAIASARLVRDGHKAYERDTVTFDERRISYPLFGWLMFAMVRDRVLRVMDFGGALGSLYYQHRFLFDAMPAFLWGVVEQAHFVDAGRSEFQTDTLHFYSDVDACMAEMQPNFVLLAGVLQYLQEPYAVLDYVLSLQLPFVLVDRTMAQRHGPDQLAVQHVQPSIYPASYPVWMLDASRIEAVFAAHGYEVMDNFDPYPGSYFGPEGEEAPYQSWFFVRKGIVR